MNNGDNKSKDIRYAIDICIGLKEQNNIQEINRPAIHELVAWTGHEQNLVNANKQLIEIYEEKIIERIARVLGEDK